MLLCYYNISVIMNYNFVYGDRYSIIESCLKIDDEKTHRLNLHLKPDNFPLDIWKRIPQQTQILITHISNSFGNKL